MSTPFAPSGPRFVPFTGDLQTELFERKRYTFFRPWFDGARVVDAGCGEGFGTDIAAMFSAQAIGLDSDASTVSRAREAFPQARFRGGDATDCDYSKADVVLAFDLLPFVANPSRSLAAMARCEGSLAVSVPNPQHVPIEPATGRRNAWDARAFQALTSGAFGNRAVAWLSQAARFPGDFAEGLDPQALYWFALVGDRQVPRWPAIGNTMPCYDNAQMARLSVHTNLGAYPGRMGFAVVANGCSAEETAVLEALRAELPGHVLLAHEPVNLGGGAGWNQAVRMALEHGFDLYAGCGDDVFPSPSCLGEMVWVLQSLAQEGLNPGMVAPMSNAVSGRQQVAIGEIGSYTDVLRLAPGYERRHVRSATPMPRLMPLMFLCPPAVFDTVGAFDPRFGFGTCGDDDFNTRLRLSGFTTWSADGAFAYHVGSVSFRRTGLDMQRDWDRALRTLLAKYRCASYEEVYALTAAPEGVPLFLQVGARRTPDTAFEVPLDGRRIDLVLEATDEEFAAWVAIELANRPREDRWRVLRAIGAAPAA
jgi:GT2 family glycosyltransferase/SAM-dependent methyltransferase